MTVYKVLQQIPILIAHCLSVKNGLRSFFVQIFFTIY